MEERRKIASLLFPREVRRQELGEKLYPMVAAVEEDQAGLVTGMLLTLDTHVLEEMVEDEEEVARMVARAVARIEQARREKEDCDGSDKESTESHDSLDS